MIHDWARLPVGVSPHIADAPANMMTPRVTILLWPMSVGESPTEREQRSEGEDVCVDRPLDAGARQSQL